MKNNKKFFFIIILLTSLVIFYVFKNVSPTQIVCSDEGDYIWTGHIITKAIRQKDWRLFWQLTYPQFHYPFFQSWYLGFATLPFEYTLETARLVSLLLLLPTIILIWLTAKKMSQKIAVPILACGLTLSSPLMLFYFSNAMKEGLATFLSFLTIFFYFEAREKKSPLRFLIVSFLILALTLTKYNYGALVLAALGLESFFWLIKDKGYRKKDFWSKNLLLYLPFLIGFTLWLFYPINRFRYLFPFPQSKDVFNLYQTTLLGHLLYYPLELTFSYTFSWLAFLSLAFGFLWALKSWRDYKIRVLAGFFLINFILAEKHIINNQARYIFTSVPAFFLIATLGLVQTWPLLKKIIRKIAKNSLIFGLAIPFLIAGVIILIKDLIIFPKFISRTGSHEIQTALFYEQDYQNISMFNFNRDLWPKIPPPVNYENFQDVMNFILTNVDLRKNITLVGGLNEFNRGIFDFYIDKARENLASQGEALRSWQARTSSYQEYLVVLQVKEGSRFDNFDYRVFGQLRSYQASQQALADKGLKRLAERYFPYLGLTVTILGR